MSYKINDKYICICNFKYVSLNMYIYFICKYTFLIKINIQLLFNVFEWNEKLY